MGRAKNTIKQSDISSTPIKVYYSASYASQSLQAYGITTNRGTNYSNYLSLTSTQKTRTTKYRVVKQLYYENYLTGSLIGSASYWNPSAQSTAGTGSFDSDNRTFPSTVSSNVSYFAIPSRTYGEQIKRGSFEINSTTNSYKLIDDGNGNLVDAINGSLHVGNILYAQGMVVITNNEYVGIGMNNSFSISLTVL